MPAATSPTVNQGLNNAAIHTAISATTTSSLRVNRGNTTIGRPMITALAIAPRISDRVAFTIIPVTMIINAAYSTTPHFLRCLPIPYQLYSSAANAGGIAIARS